jgi:hypothetical protein
MAVIQDLDPNATPFGLSLSKPCLLSTSAWTSSARTVTGRTS